jgi:tRNA(Ile)-lysidine synthase
MTKKIEKHIKENLNNTKNYVIALSGGVDSAVLAKIASENTKKLRSVFVRHNQEHSEDLEKAAKSIAKKLKIKHKVLDSPLELGSSETKMREVRYELLFKELKNGEILLTGHTLSDKVETFFLNLLRGTRVQGLKSIPQVIDNIERPLINISKNEIVTYAKEHKIEYLDDLTNFENKILRNWIRNELIPEVDKRLPGNVEEKISLLVNEIETIFDDNNLNFKYIKLANGYIEIPIRLVQNRNIKRNIYLSLISNAIGIPSFQKKDIEKIENVINTGSKTQLNNDWSCTSSNSLLIFINKKNWLEEYQKQDKHFGYFKFSLEDNISFNNNWTARLPIDYENIEIRPLNDGDKILINGKENKVSEVLRNYGIRNLLKEVWPIISKDEEILWIPGVRKSDLLKKYEINKESNILVASIEKSSFEHS